MEDRFEFTYSAPQQAEIKRIKEKYLPDTAEQKLEQLRRLDRSVETPGVTLSLIFGIVGTLVFGTGMSLALVGRYYVPAIIVSLIGLALAALAMPVYKRVTAKRRKKLGAKILALADELQGNKNASP